LIDWLNPKKNNSSEELYISVKMLDKICRFLEKEPKALRMSAISEEGWFNKKESYVRKRLKYIKREGKFYLAISDIHRSFNGKRVTKYLVYWLSDKDISHINNQKEAEMKGEFVPLETLQTLYKVIPVDREGEE